MPWPSASNFEFLEQFTLATGQVLRRLDGHLNIHVATRRAAQHGETLAAQAELVAGLGARGDLHLCLAAIDRGDFHVAAQRRLGHAQWHAHQDVGAVALEDRVWAYRHMHIQVAGRGALAAGLAFAGQADPGAIFDAGWDLHLSVRSRPTVPTPWQTLHGLRMVRPAPPQVGQVRSTRKKPCCVRNLPVPLQVEQVSAVRFLSSEPVPVQASHTTRVGTRTFALAPAKASVNSISTAARMSLPARLRPATATAATHELAEHLLEDVAHAAGGLEIEAAAEAALAALFERCMAVTVIGGALLVVFQDVVGFVDFLELGFACLSPGLRSG